MWDYLAKTVTKDVNFSVSVNHHRRRERELMPPPEHGFYGEKFADDVKFVKNANQNDARLPFRHKSLTQPGRIRTYILSHLQCFSTGLRYQ